MIIIILEIWGNFKVCFMGIKLNWWLENKGISFLGGIWYVFSKFLLTRGSRYIKLWIFYLSNYKIIVISFFLELCLDKSLKNLSFVYNVRLGILGINFVGDEFRSLRS